MNAVKPLSYEEEIPDVLAAMAGVHEAMNAHGLDRKIQHLVHLRTSQINRCGFCVKMHTKEARQDGETSDRLDRVVVWDQVRDFSEPEQAALAWTEALTELNSGADFTALRTRLREHFSNEEISILTINVAMTNLWNRIQISRHRNA